MSVPLRYKPKGTRKRWYFPCKDVALYGKVLQVEVVQEAVAVAAVDDSSFTITLTWIKNQTTTPLSSFRFLPRLSSRWHGKNHPRTLCCNRTAGGKADGGRHGFNCVRPIRCGGKKIRYRFASAFWKGGKGTEMAAFPMQGNRP